MDKFDEHEVCPACGNDPVESGLKWKPKFAQAKNLEDCSAVMKVGGAPTTPHLDVSCGQCRYKMKRGCLGNV